jgi:hypothetical protein
MQVIITDPFCEQQADEIPATQGPLQDRMMVLD